MLEALGDGVILPAVFFALPICQMALVFLYYFYTLVGRAAVHDDVFEVRVALVEDRADRVLEIPSLVVRRCDNREFRKAGQRCHKRVMNFAYDASDRNRICGLGRRAARAKHTNDVGGTHLRYERTLNPPGRVRRRGDDT